MRSGALLLCLWAAAGSAQGLDLTAAERAAFGAELRDFLLDEPELVARALSADDPSGYADEITADLALIDQHRDQLFTADGATILGITGPIAFTSFATPDSATATMLAELAATQGIRIALRDPASHTDLMRALHLDTIPSHVFPHLMVRGDVPPIVLQRYLP